MMQSSTTGCPRLFQVFRPRRIRLRRTSFIPHPFLLAILLLASTAGAVTNYVAIDSLNPVPPYTNWATAATNIQAAVDVAQAGDTVLVSNGVYETGARVTPGYSLLNRVVITNNILVKSVNGPEVTIIKGQGPLGDDAVRCVRINKGILYGFTLTGGHTLTSGDLRYDVSGGGVQAAGGIVSNCIVIGNLAYNGGGGGAYGLWSSCTIVSNQALRGGGTYYSGMTNCVLVNNSASDRGGGSCNGGLTNCTIGWNTATFGGGADSGALKGCGVVSNVATESGGGSYYASLSNCVLRDNMADNGGGAAYGALIKCSVVGNSAVRGGGGYCARIVLSALSSNSAVYGAGAYSCGLSNCIVECNVASNSGGGGYAVAFTNCTLEKNLAESGGALFGGRAESSLLLENRATGAGGGANGGVLVNCTMIGNSANRGGGVANGTLTNCIVYDNSSYGYGRNYIESLLSYCCTTPDPGGLGNITSAPQIVSSGHIAVDSPCVMAGISISRVAADIDGQQWNGSPSIGCDEPMSGTLTGALSVAIGAQSTTVATHAVVGFEARVSGRCSSNLWSWSDGQYLSNGVYVSHTWTTSGEYRVTLTAFNESHPEGIAASTTVQVLSAEATAR